MTFQQVLFEQFGLRDIESLTDLLQRQGETVQYLARSIPSKRREYVQEDIPDDLDREGRVFSFYFKGENHPDSQDRIFFSNGNDETLMFTAKPDFIQMLRSAYDDQKETLTGYKPALQIGETHFPISVEGFENASKHYTEGTNSELSIVWTLRYR